MQVEDEGPALTLSPSFRESADDPLSSTAGEGSPLWISAADDRENSRVEDDGSSDDLDFAFVVSDPDLGPDITVADEIFSDGRIRPVYPVFNRDLLLADSAVDEKAARLSLRRLLIEDREPCSRSGSVSSSSSMDDLEGIPPGTYCVWTPRSVPPSPDRCKKSKSTGSGSGSGSGSRRWRIRDLVVGRSQSDGKDKFVFLASPEKEKRPDGEAAAKGKGTAVAVAEENNKGNNVKGDRVTEMDMVTAHRLYYAKGGGGSGSGSGGSARQSFLPYKRNLVGFFVNGKGSSRTHHPF